MASRHSRGSGTSKPSLHHSTYLDLCSYAQAPTGPLRFKPSGLLDTKFPGGSYDASKFRATCHQTYGYGDIDPSEFPEPNAPPPSEDCELEIMACPSSLNTPLRQVSFLIFGDRLQLSKGVLGYFLSCCGSTGAASALAQGRNVGIMARTWQRKET
jgi:hypothetical protein